MLCQMLTKTLQDKKCCASSSTALNSQASLDLSFLYKCFPCTSCSMRRFMRSCCNPDCQESLRKFVTCECARTTIYGNTQNLDLICCSI
uniref:Ovule protein n=1 Tax=Globodera pallida TaxID=36090 RepID=A0A183C627_GLOPA